MRHPSFGRLVAAAIVVMFACDASAADRCSAPPPTLGKYQAAVPPKPAPEEPFFADGERERQLSDLRGKALIVNFWATWCAPCVEEMPSLDALNAALRGDGIAVLPLSADREGAPVVRKFYAKNDLQNLPVATDRRGALARALGLTGLPTTVLFDAAGREVGRVVGTAKWDARESIAFLRRCLQPTA